MGSFTRVREGNFRLICGRNEMDALMGESRSFAIRAARSRFIIRNFLAAVFSGVVSAASVGVEDEDGTVFEGDFDWLSGCEALVEQVETRLRIVVWDRFADGLPRGFDGLEGFDVEGRVRRWRSMTPSHSPWRRRKNGTSAGRTMVPTHCMVACQ